MHRVRIIPFIRSLFTIPALAFSQASKQDSIRQPLKRFTGRWKGIGGGQPGTGIDQRSYQFVLNRRHLQVGNKSTYPPTGQHPEGEVYEDIGHSRYDKIRHTFNLRQFHVEGFVHQYRPDSLSADGRTIVFVSEAIENIPAGWRARERYHIPDNDHIEETFEPAEPGNAFELYSNGTLHRDQ